MKVLMMGWDSSALKSPKKQRGDFSDRLNEYGKYLDKIFIIAYSPRKLHNKPNIQGNNIFVYPTDSIFPPTLVLDGIRIVRGIAKTDSLDVVSSQDPFLFGVLGYLIKRRYRVPLNVQIHADYLDNKYWLNESFLNVFYNALGKLIIRRADTVRVVNLKLKRYLEETLHIPEEKIFVVPVIVNIKKFIDYRPAYPPRNLFPGFDNYILFVGRLVKQKDVPNLISAIPHVLKDHPKTLFVIIGTGPERENLERLAGALHIKENIAFKGFVKNEELPEYYHASDIFVLPSSYEGWGLVAIEAMACGKPVVMTDVGCAGEMVIDGKTGYVVPVNDPGALAEKINSLLDNPELRKEMGDCGRSLAIETQDIQKNALKNAEVYRRTAHAKG